MAVVMKRLAAAVIALLAIVILTGCADAPARDGRYATHDGGRGNMFY